MIFQNYHLRRIMILSSLIILNSCKTRSTNDATAKTSTKANESSLEEKSLGAISFDSITAKSQTLKITVPADALSVTIYVTEASGQDYYLITDVSSPDGTSVVTSTAKSLDDLLKTGEFGTRELNSANRSVYFDQGFSSVMIPSNPNVVLSPGVWEFKVMGVEQTTTQVNSSRKAPIVDVIIKRGTLTPKSRGKLSVACFFSGSDGITSANYNTNSYFQGIFTQFQKIYADAGIDVQIASAQDLPLGLRSIQAWTDSFQNTFKATSGTASVNLLFVESLDLNGGKAAGFSGGIPGRPNIAGKPYAGVVVITPAVGPFERRAPPAIVLAHELGHYLGLSHTFEQVMSTKPADIDQLSDTPTDWSKNLMDFGVNPFPAESTVVTPQQKQVLLRSPAVVTTN